MDKTCDRECEDEGIASGQRRAMAEPENDETERRMSWVTVAGMTMRQACATVHT